MYERGHLVNAYYAHIGRLYMRMSLVSIMRYKNKRYLTVMWKETAFLWMVSTYTAWSCECIGKTYQKEIEITLDKPNYRVNDKACVCCYVAKLRQRVEFLRYKGTHPSELICVERLNGQFTILQDSILCQKTGNGALLKFTNLSAFVGSYIVCKLLNTDNTKSEKYMKISQSDIYQAETTMQLAEHGTTPTIFDEESSTEKNVKKNESLIKMIVPTASLTNHDEPSALLTLVFYIALTLFVVTFLLATVYFCYYYFTRKRCPLCWKCKEQRHKVIKKYIPCIRKKLPSTEPNDGYLTPKHEQS